ncbi:MAG TPA: hypothetical protein PKA41_17770, partial [Verrucomicrobiota bacterium]|nr:hypothetical protein [Verrucomicrobiota bacterium]
MKPAWMPLTPRGVAAFAHATTGRLLLVQFLFALTAGIVVAWFAQFAVFPVISRAIAQLPEQGEIRSRQLDWRGDSPQLLAEGGVLALTVDLNHAGDVRPLADVAVEFGRDGWRARSLFGIMEARYPSGWVIAFNRAELNPKWGAWRPVFLAGAVAGTTVWLMLTWAFLAALYAPVVRVAGEFADRDLDFVRSWRMSAAALMPGALIMTASIAAYGIGLMDLVGFLFAFGIHLAVGWVCLF